MKESPIFSVDHDVVRVSITKAQDIGGNTVTSARPNKILFNCVSLLGSPSHILVIHFHPFFENLPVLRPTVGFIETFFLLFFHVLEIHLVLEEIIYRAVVEG